MSRFYVYRIFDGFETVYVGKGSGYRLSRQIKKFGLSGEIIEECPNDDSAFAREIFWIGELRPTQNKAPGGRGGRCQLKPLTREEKVAIRAFEKIEREMERIGSRRYTAIKLLEFDLSALVSPSKIEEIRQVARGPRC